MMTLSIAFKISNEQKYSISQYHMDRFIADTRPEIE